VRRRRDRATWIKYVVASMPIGKRFLSDWWSWLRRISLSNADRIAFPCRLGVWADYSCPEDRRNSHLNALEGWIVGAAEGHDGRTLVDASWRLRACSTTEDITAP
jgi:hypothetical protein